MNSNESRPIPSLPSPSPILSSLQTIIQEYRLIDQYLNLDQHSHYDQTEIFVKRQQAQIICEVKTHETIVPPSIHQKKPKSVFHNFQKHLASLLRKFIHIRKDKIPGDESGDLAYTIWTIFMETNASNKKLLNLVFGSSLISKISFQQKGQDQNLQNFRQIFSKYSYSEICQAQALLRLAVTSQVKTLSKEFVRANTNIGKFKEFYHYFEVFIAEMAEGPLSRRMSKKIKKRHGRVQLDDDSQ